MFNKLLSKLKTSKLPKFFINTEKFLASFSFGQPFKYFRILSPTYYTKMVQTINNRIATPGSRRVVFRLPSIFETQRTIFKRFINKKTVFGALALSLTLYFAYEYNPWMTEIRLYYDKNSLTDAIVPSMTSLYEKHFYPSFIGTTALLQAIINNFSGTAGIHYAREPILLSDGGQITLDWALPVKRIEYAGSPLSGRYYPYEPSKDTKIMFIIHGLTGGSETNYIQDLVDAARKKGYRVVVMNQRGVNQPLATPLPFHGGRLEDLAIGLSYVKKKYPQAPILAVGTSFGGNQLIRHLSEVGSDTNIVAGVSLSAPFDIDDCMNKIENTVYEQFFVSTYFEKNFLPNFDIFQKLVHTHGINFEEVLKAKKIRHFHNLFTVKLFDHKDVSEYFGTINIKDYHISNIKVPLLLLQAKDDPISIHESIPIETLKKNPNLILAETSRGGHLCWFTGIIPKRWYSTPTIEFLDKILELKQKEK